MSDSNGGEEVEINVANLRRLARTIREHKDQFDLHHWVTATRVKGVRRPSQLPSPLHDCGTVCCICGFANALAGTPDSFGEGIGYDNLHAAANFLGLPHAFAKALFLPSVYSGPADPWVQSRNLGLVDVRANLWGLSAVQVADVLDAIADGRIKVPAENL